MAQYSDIIAGLTVGSYTGQVPPAEFSSVFDGPFTTQQLIVFEDPTTPSGKALNVNLQGLSSRTLWRLNAINQTIDPDAGTSTSLIIIRPKNTVSGASATFGGVATRGTGTGTSETAAVANYARNGSSAAKLRASTYTNATSAFTESTASGMWSQNEPFALIVAVEDSTMAIASYPVTDIFGTPTAEVTRACPASNANNWHGLFAFGADADYDVLYYSIGTGTDMPPLPPVVVDPPATAPGSPVATGDSSSTITLTYDAVSGASGYEYELNGGAAVDVGSSLSPLVSGLAASTEYEFRVRAYNSAGDGPWSTVFIGTTLAAGTNIVLIADVDSGNISQSLTNIINPASSTPRIELKTRSAADTGSNGSGWRQAGPFIIQDAEGKSPVFAANRLDMTERFESPSTLYLPMYTLDAPSVLEKTYVQATSRSLIGGTSGTIEWSFPDPLPAGTIYVMTNPVGSQSEAASLATMLLTDYSSVAAPTASADVNGVYYTTIAEVDENDRQIGGHNCYAFQIQFGGSTTDGGPKRKLIMTAGQHAAGEASSWLAFYRCLKYILDSSNADAVAMRANFDIYAYWNITANGLFGGHRRHNFRNTIDSNRDFVNQALPEVAAVTSAILADTEGSADVVFDWHCYADAKDKFIALTPDTPTARRFIELGEPIFGEPARPDEWSTVTTGMNAWAYNNLGVTFASACECPQRGDTSAANYNFIGESWAKTLASADADGMFYEAPAETESTVAVNWPIFNVAVSQQSELPENNSSVAAEWPLFSVAVQQSQELPGGSASISISWPMPGFVVSQESTVPDFTSSIAIQWPLFGVSISQENQQPANGADIGFSWPMFAVVASQESTVTESSSDIAITWPMFSVSILSGQFGYFTSPKARVDIPSLSRRVDI